jgi:hypothetical protein
VALSGVGVSAGETEQDIINRFTKKIASKHVQRISWLSANFTLNRINRDNDYNKFATYQSAYITDGEFTWLNTSQSFGADFGILVQRKIAWTVGGEYWGKFGQTLSGTFTYTPPNSGAVQITDPSSTISVYGLTTGLQYYLYNAPGGGASPTKPALRLTGTVGYYHASWEVWDEYQNLNLATSTPAGINSSFSGATAGFSIGLGGDYPLKVWGLVLGADMNYLHLNFKNISWYNSADQEIVATYNDTPEGRVLLGLSGVRGKVELKKYFTW